ADRYLVRDWWPTICWPADGERDGSSRRDHDRAGNQVELRVDGRVVDHDRWRPNLIWATDVRVAEINAGGPVGASHDGRGHHNGQRSHEQSAAYSSRHLPPPSVERLPTLRPSSFVVNATSGSRQRTVLGFESAGRRRRCASDSSRPPRTA